MLLLGLEVNEWRVHSVHERGLISLIVWFVMVQLEIHDGKHVEYRIELVQL
jgi:hypothetical protein